MNQWIFTGLALTFITAVPSYAVKGKYCDSKEHLPDSVCKIGIFSQDGKLLDSCSGTVVDVKGQRAILSDAHCETILDYQDGSTARFRCGPYASRAIPVNASQASSHEHDPAYPTSADKSSPIRKTSFLHIHDIALFFSRDALPPAVAIVHSKQEADELLSHPERCRIYGYGLDNFNRSGTLHCAVFQPTVPQKTFINGYYTASGPNHASHGDSGGPVLCESSNGVWTLVALNSTESTVGEPLSLHEHIDGSLDWLYAQGVLPPPTQTASGPAQSEPPFAKSNAASGM